MTLTRKITLGLALIVCALSIYFVYVWSYANSVVSDIHALNDDELVLLNATWEMRWLGEDTVLTVDQLIISGGEQQWRDQYRMENARLDDDLATATDNATPSDLRLLAAVGEANQDRLLYEAKIIDLVDQGDLAAANDIYDGPYNHSVQSYQQDLERVFQAQTFRTDASFESRLNAAKSNRIIATGVLGAIIVLIILLGALMISSIVKRVRRLTASAKAMASGELDVRTDVEGNDEIGWLAGAFNDMSHSLAGVVRQLQTEARRDAFASQLSEAFEVLDSEKEVYEVVQRAMEKTMPEAPMELLLADSSLAHIERVATSPSAGAPCCPVDSPWSCPAVRRGSVLQFETSDALNACPKLLNRPSGPHSAVCVPVSFMGKSLGVLHATGDNGVPLSKESVERMTILAAQSGVRIGTVRAFLRSEVQASTDVLTGLLNRRAFEERASELTYHGEAFAAVMADLDHFKHLNDAFGHQVGDRALRVFSATLKAALRANDIVSRYGGEEFALILPGLDANGAVEVLERFRARLASATGIGDVPEFTASFGVADTMSATTFEDILHSADVALFQAKEQGRNRVVVASLTKRADQDASDRLAA